MKLLEKVILKEQFVFLETTMMFLVRILLLEKQVISMMDPNGQLIWLFKMLLVILLEVLLGFLFIMEEELDGGKLLMEDLDLSLMEVKMQKKKLNLCLDGMLIMEYAEEHGVEMILL